MINVLFELRIIQFCAFNHVQGSSPEGKWCLAEVDPRIQSGCLLFLGREPTQSQSNCSMRCAEVCDEENRTATEGRSTTVMIPARPVLTSQKRPFVRSCKEKQP